MIRAKIIFSVLALLLLCSCRLSYDGREGIFDSTMGCPANPCEPTATPGAPPAETP